MTWAMYEVGEVVVHPKYGRGVVRDVDSSGYLKIIFESDAHNWAAWWFTPGTVTKLQIGESNECRANGGSVDVGQKTKGERENENPN